MKAQPVPPAAVRDSDAVEMARIWIAECGLHCSLRIGMYVEDGADNEVPAWGMILADMTHHIASALEAEGLGDTADLKHRIAAAFNSEIGQPTTKHDTGPSAGAN